MKLVQLIPLGCALTMYANTTLADTYTPDFIYKSALKSQGKAPPPRRWDWVQLTSGEWLKGEIKFLYEDTLEFDSDILDILNIDLEDIEQLYSARPQAVRLEHLKDNITGLVVITPKIITITNSHDKHTFPRSDIVTFVSGEPKERNFWSIDIGISSSFRAGNTQQVDYDTSLSARRRTPNSRLSMDYGGLFTEIEEIETANNHRTNVSYDIFATQRKFYRPIVAEIFSDRFQNISSRGTIGAGIGYYFIDNKKTEWDVFAGPGLQYTRFNKVEEGKDRREGSMTFIASTNFSHELTKTIDLDVTYQTVNANTASGGYTHTFQTKFSFELTGSIDIDTTLKWDYIESPTANEEGIFPVNSDYRLLFGVSYEFN